MYDVCTCTCIYVCAVTSVVVFSFCTSSAVYFFVDLLKCIIYKHVYII